MINKNYLFLLLLTGFIFYGCNDSTDKGSKDQLKAGVFGQGSILISNAWIRPGASGMNTAFFFDVYNSSHISDTLLSAESELAEIVEIHETFTKGEDMMGMRSVDFVEIAGETKFEFKPMHHHVMLIKIIKDLKIDNEGIVKLRFKNAGDVVVTAKVVDMMMNR
jgi:copper(I)-binding protein